MLPKILFSFFLLTSIFQKEVLAAQHHFSKFAKSTLSEMIDHNASLEDSALDNPDFISFKVFEEKNKKDAKKIILIVDNKVVHSTVQNRLPTFYLNQQDTSWMGRFYKKGFSTVTKWFTPKVMAVVALVCYGDRVILSSFILNKLNKSFRPVFNLMNLLHFFLPLLHGVIDGANEVVFFPLPYDKNSRDASQETVLIVKKEAAAVIEKNIISKNFQEITF